MASEKGPEVPQGDLKLLISEDQSLTPEVR